MRILTLHLKNQVAHVIMDICPLKTLTYINLRYDGGSIELRACNGPAYTIIYLNQEVGNRT